jgi:regulator of sigma E protease
LDSVLIFLLFLAPLIFFHELGHFLFARLFGVKVETFSIGFGPKIARFKKGDTDYAISLIPLGGYVKMFGDDPLSDTELTEEEKAVAFTHKSKWARFWIVFGGPLANFILAFVLYFGLLLTGEKVPEPRLGQIQKNTLFHQAGLRSGDILKQINETEVSSFDDITGVDGIITRMVVNRAGVEKTLKVSIDSNAFITEFPKLTGQLRAPVVQNSKGERFYLSSSQSKLTKFSFEQLQSSDLRTVYLKKILNPEQKDPKQFNFADNIVQVDIATGESLDQALRNQGVYPVDLVIDSIVMSSAAEVTGLKRNDILVDFDGDKLISFMQIREKLASLSKAQELPLTVLRDGKFEKFKITPKEKEVNGEKLLLIGVYSSIVPQPLTMVETDSKGLFSSLPLAFMRTLDGINKTFVGFKKLIFGEVSVKNLGGPIAIGKVATDSFYISFSMFIRLMAIISINLGLINLFPIPVLDGGHIVFIGLEILNGGPLSRKKMQIAQQFGMSLLFLLIFVALFNDISRFIG